MIGNIYINGQIGSTPETKGVELIDVVSQVEPLKGCTQINCYINSQGGSVEVGRSIAEYLKTIPNLYTIATGLCASIATEIHLCVPVENRKIVAGTEYMIHNPLFSNIEQANSNDLEEMLSVLKPIENQMVKMYSKATGTSEEAISALMDVEAFLTEDQLLSLGFVSEILPKNKPLAFLNTENKMSKTNIKLGLFAKSMAKIKGREVQAIMADVTQGTIETPFADLMVGDPILLNGVEAPADTYILSDGTQLVVTEVGIIAEIVNPQGATVEYYQQQVEDMKAELEALKAELATANEAKAELATVKEAMAIMEKEHSEVLAIVEDLKAKKSTFVPPVAQANFRKPNAEPVKSAVEVLAEKRAMLKNKNK